MSTQESYQNLTAELDDILASLQSGTVNIDQALIQYERGLKIISKLEEQLKTAENKITKLKG